MSNLLQTPPESPFSLFEAWYAEAKLHVNEPSAMTLATADREGRPSARQVLLKQADEQGFVFFTNYQSTKATNLEQNPWASLLFWWDPLARQIRIEGRVTKVSAAESDSYFASRPRDSQIGAWASPQSQPIAGRDTLMTKVQELERQFAGQPVPRPPHWGGYRVHPERIEFWQGQASRLHDRLIYSLVNGNWQRQWLAP